MHRFLALVAFALLASACTAPSQLGQPDRDRIAGRTFVITGASSGLGRGVALKLASYGGNVVLAARRANVLEEVAAQARGAGAQALSVPTDVSQPDQVARLAQSAVARFGRIDAWINDAGIAALGDFTQVPLEDHARVVDVNLKGTLYGTYAALKQFHRQGFGTLVNIGSVESRVPVALHASYAATKAAILALDNAVYEELRLAGATQIHVVTVLPWAIDTPFWTHTGNYTGHTPTIATMDPPEPTVDAVIWATIHPQKEYAAGFKAGGAVVGSQLWPGLANRIGADVQKSSFQSAPSAPPTNGNLFTPMQAGTGVDGGMRAKMEREDQRRIR